MKYKIFIFCIMVSAFFILISSTTQFVYVKVAPGYIRKAPRLTSEIIERCPEGTKLKVLEIKKPWYKVENQNSKKVGWLHDSAIVLQELKQKTTNVKSSTYSEAEAYLATKAFNERVESYHKSRSRGNYGDVNKMESIRPSLDELIKFIREGNLNE